MGIKDRVVAWWTSGRGQRTANLLFPVVLAVYATVYELLHAALSTHNFPRLSWEILTSLVAAASLYYRRTHALVALLLSVVCWLVTDLLVYTMAASYSTARYQPRGWLLALAGAGAIYPLGIVDSPLSYDNELIDLPTYTIPVYAVVMPSLVGLLVRQWLISFRLVRERVERQAVSGERIRISREMHDLVGHRLSLLMLHSTALQAVGGDDPRISRLSSMIRAECAGALEELRSLVGLLRRDDDVVPATVHGRPVPPEEFLERHRAAGMSIVYTEEGDASELRPEVALAVSRLLHEGLSNAVKHAPGAALDVRITRTAESVTVRLHNPPASKGMSPARVPGGGHGLRGLAERVHLLGGTFSAHHDANGDFTMVAEIPTQGVTS
ncbi:hypothetical protein H9Y04_44650 [Streptomyces sp. TRM66268-LWL]|uniref:histidine kinase n=1 Tax=Streptomyces polyasparticus TaxID=2767826 RepID=A0ABR7SXB2_9ACTN|nr:histidine kinase [Streptomyces polyasparticus]MBC9719597.1 hypothetical protein [Streptomyces polyasparticus]